MDFDISQIIRDYGLDDLEAKLDQAFPETNFSIEQVFGQILTGDFKGGVLGGIKQAVLSSFQEYSSLRNTAVWLLAFGIAAALVSYFTEMFSNHQVADLSFYFIYMLMMTVLFRCFETIAALAARSMQEILVLVKILIPAFLLSVGVSCGSLTAASGYEIWLLIIFLIENVLTKAVLPLIYGYVLLAVLNGIWEEDRLALLVQGVEKLIKLILKVSIGVITGAGTLQSMLTPAIDSVKTSLVQKTVSAIPGVGNVADGFVEAAIGSAVIIKNSMGLVLLICLLILVLPFLLKIFLTSFLLKTTAALLGLISDKRVTICTDKVGNATRLLFQTSGTAVLLFVILISITAYTTNRGF